MPSVGILFDVVIDASRREGPLQPVRGTTQRPVLRAKTSDDRTNPGQEAVGVLRDRPIVDARRREPVAGGEQ